LLLGFSFFFFASLLAGLRQANSGAKVRISERKTKKNFGFSEREYLRAQLKDTNKRAKNQKNFWFFRA